MVGTVPNVGCTHFLFLLYPLLVKAVWALPLLACVLLTSLFLLAAATEPPPGKRPKSPNSKVDQLTEELNQRNPLFLILQSGTGAGDVAAPSGAMLHPDDDTLSMMEDEKDETEQKLCM